MSFRAALFTYLSTGGTIAGTRVYPRKLPQTVTLPAVTYHRVSEVGVDSQSGPSNLVYDRYQVTAWSTSDAQAEQLRGELRALLGSVKGLWSGYRVTSRHAGGIDLIDTQTGRLMAVQDFFISHEEAL